LQLVGCIAKAVKTSLAEGYHSPIAQQLAELTKKSIGGSYAGMPGMNAHREVTSLARQTPHPGNHIHYSLCGTQGGDMGMYIYDFVHIDVRMRDAADGYGTGS
jgi:hypothetical protein